MRGRVAEALTLVVAPGHHVARHQDDGADRHVPVGEGRLGLRQGQLHRLLVVHSVTVVSGFAGGLDRNCPGRLAGHGFGEDDFNSHVETDPRQEDPGGASNSVQHKPFGRCWGRPAGFEWRIGSAEETSVSPARTPRSPTPTAGGGGSGI